MSLHSYALPLIVFAMFGLFLAIFLARIRYLPGTRSLILLIAAVSFWCVGYALEFLSASLEAKIFWAKFQYLGIVVVPIAWLYFTHRYLGFEEWPSPSRMTEVLLTSLPALTLLIVWTNDFHHLIWSDINQEKTGAVIILSFHHGPWFWIYWFYSYVLIFLGTFRLVETLITTPHLDQWQTRLTLIACTAPWLGNLLYVSGLSPVKNLDITPFAFIIAGLILTISISRYPETNRLPVAHEQIFVGQADGLIVLDGNGIITDLNPVALKMAGVRGRLAIGKPFARVFPELVPWVELADQKGEYHRQISTGAGASLRYYDLHLSQLSNPKTGAAGLLVALHDVTAIWHEQAQLQQAVSDQTAALRRAIKRLEDELNQRVLAEKRLQAVLDTVTDAMLLVDQHYRIRLVNTQAESLFGYSRQELVGQPIDLLVPVQSRPHHQDCTEAYFSNPTVMHFRFGANFYGRRKDGRDFPIEASLGPLNIPEGVWAACTIRELSEYPPVEAGFGAHPASLADITGELEIPLS